MPVHPTEESAPSNITDKVAKESRDSTASDHPLHNENEGPVKGTSRDHAGKGPAIPEKMPDAQGTKDELKAKAQEMNK